MRWRTQCWALTIRLHSLAGVRPASRLSNFSMAAISSVSARLCLMAFSHKNASITSLCVNLS